MSAAPRYVVADRPRLSLADVALKWETILVALLALVFLVDSRLSPYFLDPYNLADATFNFSEKAILALAMALLIIVRDIDLSVAAIIAVASLCMGLAASAGAPTPALVVIGLCVGLVCGCVNGALTVGFALPSIVVTIGTMSLFRGLAQVVLGDQALTKYPAAFQAIGQGYISETLPLPNSFVLFLALALVFGIGLARTTLGRRIYAMGANPTAARFSGVAVGRIRFGLFALSGLMAGLAAVLLTARIGSTRPNIAVGFELEAVTMVVLGGVSIAGGAGGILGVTLAVFVLGFVTFGLSLINVPGIVISVLEGAMLIVSIATPAILGKLLKRKV